MMFKRMNNKGYMLVEIILASAIAMGVAYFITDLTIKLKNKNDDLVVKTLVATDQAIMYNTIMEDIYSGNEFKCSDIKINGNVFKYKEFTNVVSDYATISEMECSDTDDISIYIPMKVKQLSDDFSININTKNNITGSTGGSTEESDGDSTGGTSKKYADEGSCRGIVYDGKAHTLMSGGTYVTYENNTGTEIGNYTVTIIADAGYEFESGDSFISGKYNNRHFKTHTCSITDGIFIKYQLMLSPTKGVASFYYKKCINNSCGSFVDGGRGLYIQIKSNESAKIYVYGVPEDGYTMNSCTENSPCLAFSASPPYSTSVTENPQFVLRATKS